MVHDWFLLGYVIEKGFAYGLSEVLTEFAHLTLRSSAKLALILVKCVEPWCNKEWTDHII